MDNVMLITNCNIGGTAGDATLILRRAKAMYNEKNLFTHIFLYKPIKQGNSNNGDYYYDISIIDNKTQIKKLIITMNPKYIILYGDRIQMMTRSISKYIRHNHLRSKVIIDIQGTVDEKKEYGSSFIRKHLIYSLSLLNFKISMNNADGAFVVSDEIMDRCSEVRKNHIKEIEYYKVRCGSEEIISKDKIKKNRLEFRKKLGLSDSTVVFCYSGYRAPWQKVDNIIEKFIQIDRKYPDCFFAFFCNTDDEFLQKLKESFPKGNYCAELLKPSSYFKYLCGCDVGVILRDYNETNRVAFPNKFSDYMVSGLLIALNNAIPEPMRLISKYKTHYVDLDAFDVDFIMTKVIDRQNLYDEFIDESIRICEKELLYSSQVQKLDL